MRIGKVCSEGTSGVLCAMCESGMGAVQIFLRGVVNLSTRKGCHYAG